MQKNVIIVRASGGFGNRIFFAVFSLYLSHRYGETVNMTMLDSAHSHQEHPDFTDIFNNLRQHINVISYEDMIRIKNDLGLKPVNTQDFSLDGLPGQLTRSVLFYANPFSDCCRMFNLLPDSYRLSLEVNPELISPSTMELSRGRHIAIHIRYGDKLCQALMDGSFFKSSHKGVYHRNILFTPEYYIEIINKLRDSHGLPIYIVTDSPNVVNEFILAKTNGASIIEAPYWEGFYILTRAYAIVACHSTFSFSAGYLNVNNNVYLVKKPILDMPLYNLPEDNAVSPDWNIVDNRKYILNYNQPLVKKMADCFGKCGYYKNWYNGQGEAYEGMKKLFVEDATL